jgi:membrane associated rhomboid family serine protease
MLRFLNCWPSIVTISAIRTPLVSGTAVLDGRHPSIKDGRDLPIKGRYHRDMDSAGGGMPPWDSGAAPEGEPERSSGIILETCYRHPKETTGVHCTRCGRPICPDCMRPAPVGYHCPDCVAEARRSAAGPRVRARFVLGRPGIVTTTLLIANIALFIVEIVASGGRVNLWNGFPPDKLVNLGATFPAAIVVQHQYWRLITSMFLHGSLLHILFNMYALYLFGYLVESAFGKARFIAIYFVSGFLASVTSFLFIPPNTAGVGASGAIFGLLGAWVAYNYRRRGSPLASMHLRNAMFLVVLNLVIGVSVPGIDLSAHIGGFIAGMACGTVAEGWGDRGTRRLVSVAGFAALALLGVILVMYRTSVLTG